MKKQRGKGGGRERGWRDIHTNIINMWKSRGDEEGRKAKRIERERGGKGREREYLLVELRLADRRQCGLAMCRAHRTGTGTWMHETHSCVYGNTSRVIH